MPSPAMDKALQECQTREAVIKWLEGYIVLDKGCRAYRAANSFCRRQAIDRMAAIARNNALDQAASKCDKECDYNNHPDRYEYQRACIECAKEIRALKSPHTPGDTQDQPTVSSHV